MGDDHAHRVGNKQNAWVKPKNANAHLYTQENWLHIGPFGKKEETRNSCAPRPTGISIPA
eukprot:1161864-Pelagomonas_calceolata.AAC.19